MGACRCISFTKKVKYVNSPASAGKLNPVAEDNSKDDKTKKD